MKQLKVVAALVLLLAVGGCFFPPKQPVQKELTWDPSVKPAVAPVETRTLVVTDGRLPKPSTVEAAPAPKPPPVQGSAQGAAAPMASEPAAVAMPAAIPSAPAALPPKLPTVLYFEIDHYQVAPRYRELLQQHAAVLKADPDRQVLVRGHADAVGPAEYNLALADKRAEMVVRSLASMGVSAKQMRREAVPAVRTGAAPGKRAQASARRVELVYRDAAIAGR